MGFLLQEIRYCLLFGYFNELDAAIIISDKHFTFCFCTLRSCLLTICALFDLAVGMQMHCKCIHSQLAHIMPKTELIPVRMSATLNRLDRIALCKCSVKLSEVVYANLCKSYCIVSLIYIITTVSYRMK